LQQVASYQTELGRAASERDQADREQKRLGMPLLLRFFFPLLAGLWTIVSLGAGGASMFLIMPLTQRLFGEELGGLCGGLSFLFVYALFLLSMRVLLVRNRRVNVAVPPSTIVRELCPNCGTTVPVTHGITWECPFCSADLLTSESARQHIATVTEEAVAREQRLALDARRNATRSGAENAQAILDSISMVTLLPLMFVAMPITLGRVITVALSGTFWPDAARDATVRDQRDIMGMVISGALAVTFITLGVIAAVRRERRRKLR